MKRVAVFLLSSFLLLNARGVFAQAPEEDDPLALPDEKPLLGQLNLNDQQKKQVEQMRFDMEKQLVGVRAKGELARLDLRQLLNADNADKAAIEKKMNELAQIRMQTASIRLNQWFEVNKILTAEQQKVWREVLKHPMQARGRAWMERRFMEGRGPMRHRTFMGRGRGPGAPESRMMERPEPEKK